MNPDVHPFLSRVSSPPLDPMSWLGVSAFAVWIGNHIDEATLLISQFQAMAAKTDIEQQILAWHPMIDTLAVIAKDCPAFARVHAQVATVVDEASFLAHFAKIGDGTLLKKIIPYLPWILTLISTFTGVPLPPLPPLPAPE